MLDIESFVGRNFFETTLYGHPPTDYQVNCPFCNDQHMHMHISMNKRVCHCFKCGYSSSWVGLVMDMKKVPYHVALGELYQRASLSKSSLDNLFQTELEVIEDNKVLVTLPTDFIPLYKSFGNAEYKNYLTNRGFGEKYWKRYNLGVAASVPMRVIIPIENEYWQARSIHKWLTPKYINPKAESSNAIFNSIALTMYKEIVICEGAFSAMAVGSNAIALIGKECPEEKMRRLIDAEVDRYIIALEPEAFPTMYKVMDSLYKNGKEVVVWEYSQGDPADKNGTFTEFPYTDKTKIMLALKFPNSRFGTRRIIDG